MTGEKRSFQEAVRTSILAFSSLHEDNIYFEDDNGPEAVTPYCTISVPFFQRIGAPEVSTHVSGGSPTVLGSLTLKTHYEATARLSFTGNNSAANDGGDFALEFVDQLSNPLLHLTFRKNGLSFHRNSIVRKIPKLRETRWYDAYVIDVVFAFCLETTQQIDSVDTVELTGNFQSVTTTSNQINIP